MEHGKQISVRVCVPLRLFKTSPLMVMVRTNFGSLAVLTGHVFVFVFVVCLVPARPVDPAEPLARCTVFLLQMKRSQ